jgi:hypothetical protein
MDINDYINTWKEVIQTPSDFYRKMPTNGGYNDPLTFAVISYIIYGLFAAIVQNLMFGMMGFSFSALIGTIVIIPIVCIISLFIGGAILQVIFSLLGGTGTYEGTIRFIAYASAPMVFSWIPLLGMIAGIYGLYLYIIGGMNVHKVSIQKSAIAVLLPVVVVFLVAMLLAGIAMLSIFGR